MQCLIKWISRYYIRQSITQDMQTSKWRGKRPSFYLQKLTKIFFLQDMIKVDANTKYQQKFM